jgi:hypothetical protein
MVMADRGTHAGRAATALLTATIAIAVAGCGDGVGGAGPAPYGSAGQGPTAEPARPRVLACGAEFPPPASGVLDLAGRFPATAAASGGGTVAGTVEVTSPRPVRGVVGRNAEVFLVRDGRIASVPGVHDSVGILLDLEPGEVHEMPGATDLASCAALAPGTYQVYARVSFAPDREMPTDSYGGPWPVQLT